MKICTMADEELKGGGGGGVMHLGQAFRLSG